MPIADSKSPPNRIPPSFLAIAFTWVHDSPAKTTTSSLTHSSVDYVIKLLLMDLVEMMGIPSMLLILKKMPFFGVSSLFPSPLWNTDLAVIPLWQNRWRKCPWVERTAREETHFLNNFVKQSSDYLQGSWTSVWQSTQLHSALSHCTLDPFHYVSLAFTQIKIT